MPMLIHFIILILEMIFLFLMFQGAVEDWNTRIISNRTWILANATSLIISILRGYSIKQILVYSLWLFLLFLIVGTINLLITKKEGIGGGDIKISPAVTLFAGPIGSYIILAVLILSLLGQICSKKANRKYTPLVTYFFIGCVITFIFSLN